MVMRHFQNYTVEKASEVTHTPMINAGDGTNEHPTQALLDLYTMSKELNGLEDKVKAAGTDDVFQTYRVRQKPPKTTYSCLKSAKTFSS